MENQNLINVFKPLFKCTIENQQESRGSQGRILAVILEANNLSSRGKGKLIWMLIFTYLGMMFFF